MKFVDVPGPSTAFLPRLGLRIAHEADPVVVEMDITDDLRNNAGMLQGGVIATLVDVAGGVAAARAWQTERTFTADMVVRYLAAGRVGPVRAFGSVLRSGRTLSVVDVRVIDTGANDRLMAVATMTMVMPSRPDGE